MANYKSLKHWAMIITIAYYGWGANGMVGNVTSFLGVTVTRKTMMNSTSHSLSTGLNHFDLYFHLLKRTDGVG
jgi:hypothetical protein